MDGQDESSSSASTPSSASSSWTHRVKHFASGICAGVAGVVIGHPFDTVKVRLQTQRPAACGTLPYRGTVHAFARIVSEEGPRGLFRGLSSPVVGDASTNSLVFGVYGAAQRAQLQPGQTDADFDTLSAMQIYLSGGGVGVVCAFILSPVELVKVQLQVQGAAQSAAGGGGATAGAVAGTAPKPKFRGPVDVLRNLILRHGMRRGLFLGLGATLLRDIPSFGFYFGFYEMLRRMFAGSSRTVAELSGFETMLAGAAGGVASWVVIYPFDVVKSRLQAQDLDHRVYRGTWDCMTQTFRAGGTRALFSGLGTTVLRSIPVNMAIFYTYELLNRWFES